jgi:hypothetical protein
VAASGPTEDVPLHWSVERRLGHYFCYCVFMMRLGQSICCLAATFDVGLAVSALGRGFPRDFLDEIDERGERRGSVAVLVPAARRFAVFVAQSYLARY